MAGPTRRADAPGLGWFFYASGALDDRNPWWPAMPELTRYLSRLCWLLQQGEPVADVALYVPNEDLFATMGRAQGGSLDPWREARRRIPSAIPATIRTAGLDYDLIDDDALAVTAPGPLSRWSSSRPRPRSRRRPQRWLDRVQASGGAVLSVDSTVDLPGALAAAVDPDLADLAADAGHRLRAPSLRRRSMSIFVVNTGPTTRTFDIAPRTSRAELRAVGRHVGPSAPRRSDGGGDRAHAAALRGDGDRAERRAASTPELRRRLRG